jgi:uncharacterized membrane protein YgcG
MPEERSSTSRSAPVKAGTSRPRRSRELPPELARQFARARSRARALIAAGVAGIVAGVGLVIAAHPAVGALPLIAGGVVLYRGERRLTRVDAAMRKRLYGRAAWGASAFHESGAGFPGIYGTGDACGGGGDGGGGGCGGGGN